MNDIKEDNGKLDRHSVTGFVIQPAIKKFTTYFYPDTLNEALNRFYSLTVAEGSVLLATENGLVMFDLSSHRFTLVKNNSAPAAASRITKIYTDSRKRIWLCTYYGLWLFDPGARSFESFDNKSNDLLFDDQLINDVYEDHKGQLWFGTWSRGLKRLDAAAKKVETFLHYGGGITNVVTITEQKNQAGEEELITGSTLARLDLRQNAFVPFINTGLPGPVYVKRLYTDRNNLLWISTNDGVKIYNPAKQYFRTVSLSSSVPITSQGPSVLSLGNGFLLGGEGNTALQFFSDSLTPVKNLSGRVPQQAAVMNIQQDQRKDFWLCTSNGLIQLDEQLNRKNYFQHKEGDPSSLPRDFLNNILFRNNGETWVMPWRKGIWRMDASGKFQYVITQKGDSLLPGANISKALEDARGNIWITDYSGGLFRYDPAAATVESIVANTRLTNEYIVDDKLWTVSSGNIFSADTRTGQLEVIPLPPGKNKYEFDFTPDDKGQLWIATKTGLLSYNTRNKTFQQYTSADGLFTDVLDVVITRLQNGRILMAGGTFATLFSPGLAQDAEEKHPLLFTGAFSEGEEKPVMGNHISFSWEEKNIRLNWALLNYSNPLENQYYYKLDKVNKDWKTSGNRGEVNFYSLDPGRYLFHYKAATSQGQMSEEQTLVIIIHPPFWKTWWFLTAVLLLLSFLFYRIVRYISQRNLKEKLLRLEKEQAIEKERNRISRDMHDELGSGLTRIAILTEVIKTKQQSNEQIEKISATARGLVDSLDEMVWALNPQNDSLDKLAAYIAEYTHHFLEGSGIEAKVDLPAEIKPWPVSEEKRRNLFMVVKEFLNNSVKHSRAKNLFVKLTQHATGFELLLRDDGTGFDEKTITATGNGLKNMRQRISDAGGSILLTSGTSGTEYKISFAR
ncbi:MAG: two-component regulator propeller domain-containing protein [Chitinophagaceae bacterium]